MHSAPPKKQKLEILPKKKKIYVEPDKKLRVTFSDNSYIQEENSSDTLVKVIERLGVDRVKSLELKSRPSKKCKYDLISSTPNKTQSPKPLGRYFIHSRSETPEKKKILEQLQEHYKEIINIEMFQ